MGVSKRGDKLVIDFRCYAPDNTRIRCVEREGYDSIKNKNRVKSKWKAIQYHIDQGTFDYLKFFPHGTKSALFTKPKTDITFSEYWAKWLDALAISRGTEDNRKYMFENHFKPYFGTWKLQDIEEDDILEFRKTLLDAGYKPSTVNAYLKILCMPLSKATRNGLTEKNPCEAMKKLKEGTPDIEPLSFEELAHWLGYLKKKDPEWHDLILFWSQTGLRPGEFFALQWKRVDFFNSKVLIRENRPYYGGVGPTKTEKSNRDVDLSLAVIEALRRQQARTGLINKWIFLNHNKKQWNATSFRDAFKHRLRLAGLKVRSQGNMRHTFATLHIAAGDPISWVSEMMGHKNINITVERYNLFIPNLTRRDGSAFEKIMSELSKTPKKNKDIV